MSPATSGPRPLGALLSSALDFVREYRKPVLIGAAIFGTLAALLGGGVAHRAAFGVNGMMQEMGVDTQKMEDLSERMRMGDESAATEMEKLLGERMNALGEDAESVISNRFIGMFAPLIGVAAIVGIIIAIFSHAYFLLLAVSPTQDFMAVLRRTPGYFFPLLGLWIWIFLRSFIWIPFLGIIPAIILGPRFIGSSLILVKEKRGIRESVSQSYARTKGYWGKIVGNMFVAGICVALAGIVLGIVTGMVGFVIPFGGIWLQAIVKETFAAFMTVFMIQLVMTLLSNPMMAIAAAPAAPKKTAPKKKK
jgi:hypothetical protein